MRSITFAISAQEIIAKVVEKFVLQLEAQLADRDVTIELSEDAAKWLIEHGYDEQMGARPMARVIQEHIKKPLADEVLFGKLKNGGHVRVILDKDEDGARQAWLRISSTGRSRRSRKKFPGAKAEASHGAQAEAVGSERDGGPPPRGSVPKVPLVKSRGRNLVEYKRPGLRARPFRFCMA